MYKFYARSSSISDLCFSSLGSVNRQMKEITAHIAMYILQLKRKGVNRDTYIKFW